MKVELYKHTFLYIVPHVFAKNQITLVKILQLNIVFLLISNNWILSSKSISLPIF